MGLGGHVPLSDPHTCVDINGAKGKSEGVGQGVGGGQKCLLELPTMF